MIKDILKFFGNGKGKPKDSLKKEIYILTSLSTFAGGIKDSNDTYWTCGQPFLAYVDCETNQLHKMKGEISWQTKDSDNHPFDFKSKTIYKVKVKNNKENNLLSFPLIEVTESFVKNDQLLSLIDEFFIVDTVANFEFKKEDNSAEGELNWLGRDIYVYFLDVPNIDSAKQTLTHLKKMVKNTYSWNKKLRTYIAEQTLEKVNDWLLKENRYSKITKHILKEDLVIESINIYSNGDFFISYIFETYHYMINVEGNVNGDLKKAYLEE